MLLALPPPAPNGCTTRPSMEHTSRSAGEVMRRGWVEVRRNASQPRTTYPVEFLTPPHTTKTKTTKRTRVPQFANCIGWKRNTTFALTG
jgi:hypothetical protein